MKRDFLKYKGYAHFDKKMSVKKAKRLLQNEKTISEHGFYPFIHFDIKSKKLDKSLEKLYAKKDKKIRKIYYSAHMDRYIYQYYANILGQKYNSYAIANGINECSVAYRTNLGKCNIDFSYSVFEFIKSNNNSIIIIGDFTNFFDNLNHKELKSRIEEVIGNKMDDNLYKVYKSIAKFKYVDIESIYDYLTEKRGKRSEKYYLRKIDQIMSANEFREFIKSKNDKTGENILKENINSYGIVQGSPLSGLFANIYMIDFDKNMKKIADRHQGIYLRYSDDFVIVLNDIADKKIKEVYDEIQKNVLECKQIELKNEKTNIYKYSNESITCLNEKIFNTKNTTNVINFLGFAFDGKKITIRDKTITKFFYKMNRNIKKYKKNSSEVSLKKIYDKFSVQGENKKRGNFLSYVKRAEKTYKSEEKISNLRKKSKEKITHILSRKST